MSGAYRFVEHPAGVWRIEQKGLFFWSDVVICDGDSWPIRVPFLPTPGMIGPWGKRKFATLEAAKDALTTALANQAVRNIVPYEEAHHDQS